MTREQITASLTLLGFTWVSAYGRPGIARPGPFTYWTVLTPHCLPSGLYYVQRETWALPPTQTTETDGKRLSAAMLQALWDYVATHERMQK